MYPPAVSFTAGLVPHAIQNKQMADGGIHILWGPLLEATALLVACLSYACLSPFTCVLCLTHITIQTMMLENACVGAVCHVDTIA